MKTTRTYALLEVSQELYDEVKAKFEEAGYESHIDHKRGYIDMQGIALVPEGHPDVQSD